MNTDRTKMMKAQNYLRKKLERKNQIEQLDFIGADENCYSFAVTLRNWMHPNFYEVRVYKNSYKIRKI